MKYIAITLIIAIVCMTVIILIDRICECIENLKEKEDENE